MRRLVVLGTTLSLLVGLSGVPAEAAKVARPTVSRLSSSAGPLGARGLTLTGHHLKAVNAARFGTSAAHRLKHYGDSKITLQAPSRSKPGRVSVALHTSAGWTTVAPRYTYVARPVITHLSRTTSVIQGGVTVGITGRYLGTSPKVHFGSTAARITKVTASTLTAVAPAAIVGATTVVVTTPGGASPGASAARFSYVLPPAADTASFTPTASTVPATGIQWISGGPDASDPADTASDPWIVSVRPGTPLPAVGDPYYLAPGGSVLPAGLAATVSSIAAQRDGSTRLTVDPAALDNVLSSAKINFSDGPVASQPTGARRHDGGVSTGSAAQVSFPGLGPNVFSCHRKDNGASASFSGEVGLRFDRLNRGFHLDAGSHPSIDGWVSGALVSYGKVSVAAALTCDLKPSWTRANRKRLYLGDGATLSFGPAAEIKLSAAGTVSFEQTTNFMYGLSKTGSAPIQYYRIARQGPVASSSDTSVSVEASIGMSVQIGVLDTVGVQIQAKLYASGSLTLKSAPTRVCADLSFGVEVSVGAFLDLLVVRWDATALDFKIEFTALHACTAPDSEPAPDGTPQITSDVLPDATVGQDYSTPLTTADDRLGHWTLIGGTLPVGLTLAADGTLSGTPTVGVGADHPVVRFVDTSSRVAQATLLLQVLPSDGLGGGDIQATLTWNSEADLDLHAGEPDGNEIYYGNPGPSDNSGELDHDANAACQTVDPAPTENIHWPSNTAESGEYDFAVVTYDTCGTDNLDWHLVVRVDGVVQVDDTGSGDSGWYAVTYSGPDGTAQVHRLARTARRAPARGPAKS